MIRCEVCGKEEILPNHQTCKYCGCRISNDTRCEGCNAPTLDVQPILVLPGTHLRHTYNEAQRISPSSSFEEWEDAVRAIQTRRYELGLIRLQRHRCEQCTEERGNVVNEQSR